MSAEDYDEVIKKAKETLNNLYFVCDDGNGEFYDIIEKGVVLGLSIALDVEPRMISDSLCL